MERLWSLLLPVVEAVFGFVLAGVALLWWVPLVAFAAAVVLAVVRYRLETAIAEAGAVFVLEPSEKYSQSEASFRAREAVLMGRVQRGRLMSVLTRRVDGVRVVHDNNSEGLLRTWVWVPPQLIEAVRSEWSMESGVHARQVDDVSLPVFRRSTRGELSTVRTVLWVAGDEFAMLPPMSPAAPSVVAGLANHFSRLKVSSGERVAVVVDRVPLSSRETSRYKDGLDGVLDAKFEGWRSGEDGSSAGSGGDVLSRFTGLFLPGGGEQGSRAGSSTMVASNRVKSSILIRRARLYEQEPERLVRCRVTVTVSAVSHRQAVQIARDVAGVLTSRYQAEAYLRLGAAASGPLAGVLAFSRWNWPLAAAVVDRWLERCLFPLEGRPILASELGQLLYPAQGDAPSPHILRFVGLSEAPVSAAPAKRADLPVSVVDRPGGGSEVLWIDNETVRAGVFYAPMGYGKTEHMIAMALGLMQRSDCGVTLLDPQGLVGERMLPYLSEIGRPVCIVDFNAGRVPSINVLDMSTYELEQMDQVVGGAVAGFASVLGWNENTNRALTILTSTFRALVRLNFWLCQQGRPDLQTTIYSVYPFLSQRKFRETVLHFLPESYRDYWTETFPTYGAGASTVVENVFFRLRSDFDAKGACFGRPVSSYRLEDFMEQGGLTVISPVMEDDNDQLLLNLFMHQIVRGLRVRKAREQRADGSSVKPRRHFVFFDEMPMYSGPQLPKAMRTIRGFNGVPIGGSQGPEDLVETVRRPVTQNSNLVGVGLANGELDARAAAVGVPTAAIRRLPEWNWVGRVPGRAVGEKQRTSAPFQYRGVQPDDVCEAHPENVSDVVKDMDRLYDRRHRTECMDIDQLHAERSVFLLEVLDNGGPAGEALTPVPADSGPLEDSLLADDEEF